MACIKRLGASARFTRSLSVATLIAIILTLITTADTTFGSVSKPSRGFDLAESHDDARGAWSNSSTMWVVDNDDDVLIAYSVATGARLEEEDIELASYNSKPHGIWSNGSIIWVVDWDDTKLYAYDLDTGERRSGRDIDLTSANDAPRGVWGALSAIMVVDKDDTYVYAYRKTNGERLTGYEFDLAEGNDNPWGIWEHDTIMWVGDMDDNSVYAYNLGGREPNPLHNLRLSLGNQDPRGITGDDSHMWVVDEEDNHVYAIHYKDFRHPHDEIDISEVNTPRGIWTDGTTMFVIDAGTGGDPELVAYDLNDGTRDTSKDLVMDSPTDSNDNPLSVWSDGTTAWVTDGDNDALHAYELDGTPLQTGEKSWALGTGNDNPYGIWSDGDTIWVADTVDDKLYAYELATSIRRQDKEIDLASANGDPGEIWSDGRTIWVLDTVDYVAYAYRLSNGIRQRGRDFRPVPDNNNLTGGMTQHGLRFWVADSQDKKLYAYGKLNTPPSFGVSSAVFKIHYSLTGEHLVGQVPQATDVDGDRLTYSISGTDHDRFRVKSRTGEVYTRNNAGSFSAGAQLSIMVNVTDNRNDLDGVSDSVDDAVNVTIKVLRNADPEFNTADGSVFSVSENAEAGDTVAQLDVTDPDSDAVRYMLTYENANGHAPFEISDDQIKIAAAPGLDYESRASYSLELGISDGRDEDDNADLVVDDRITVTVQVSNVDEAGTVSLGSNNPQVDTALTASLTDPDGSISNLTWQWQKADTANAATWSDISGATTNSYTSGTADVGKFLRAQASYDDGEGTGKTSSDAAANAVLAVPPANSPPTFNESGPISRSLPEDAAIDSEVGLPVLATDPDSDVLTYGLVGVHSNRFEIDDQTGQIVLRDAHFLSYETNSAYYVRVQVRDGKDADGNANTLWDASMVVRIDLTNVEEAGTVDISSDNPQVGVELTASLSDPDGAVTNLEWQWQSADSAEAVTWTDISDATLETYTPTSDDAGKFIRAQASFDDGEGAGKNAHGVAPNAVVGRSANLSPEFDEGASSSRSLAEDAVAGAWVGAAVTATDPEGDMLTYSLAPGNDSDQFAIDAYTGRLTVASGATLDYESLSSLEVVVQVSDGLDADHNQDAAVDDTIVVTVSLTNVDEPGRVSLSTAAPAIGEAITASLSDPDGGETSLAWQWAKSADGATNCEDISGASASNYTPTANDAGAFLRATVSYSDGEGAGKTAAAVAAAAVPVNDEEEGGSSGVSGGDQGGTEQGSQSSDRNFYERCLRDHRSGAVARCGKNSFGVYRVELDGRYTIDWTEWDEAHPDVSGYMIMINEFVYKMYYDGGTEVSGRDLAHIYESCQFENDRWNCEGRLKAEYPQDMSGNPTQIRVVAPNVDQTQITAALEAPGHWVSDQTFQRWSGDATDPNNEPTPVSYRRHKFEMDLYLFRAHGGAGGSGAVLIDGSNGFDERPE